MTTTPVAALLNFLASLVIIAADCDDPADAEQSAEFWWLGSPGSVRYQPDGRVLTRW